MKIFWTGLRIILGMIFIISAVEKLLSPVENMVYTIQGYQILPFAFLQQLLAYVLPWAEFFVGIFLVLGLWTRLSLTVSAGFSLVFALAVAQAMLRDLPLESCGCFGEMLKMPLYVTFILDLVMLTAAVLLLLRPIYPRQYMLDRLFDK
ncbi:MAG: DoxX family protein [Candidatus Omnitrophota bacterium]